MLSRKEISKLLFKTLDEYGYSEKRVQERIWINERSSVAKTLSTREISSNSSLNKFMVGSRREGLSLVGESDEDWMQINTAVLCTDKLRNITGERGGHIIFRVCRKKAPAGYTYLRYHKQDRNQHPYFEQLLHTVEENESGTFMSSAKYMEINEDVFHKSTGWIGRNTHYREKNGPSIPKVVQIWPGIKKVHDSYDVCHDIDFVRGFQCFCPSLLNNWLHRRRFSSWPSQETIDKVAASPCYVVPVGLAGSHNEHLQWRFSFTMAEICLVCSFNETQRKMLILLRYIARHILQQTAPDITSYVMKNVAFWVVEKTPADKFIPDELFDRVVDAIEFLLECVKRRKLQNYLIPERNLFKGKLQSKKRKRLKKELGELKANANLLLSIIFQCKNVDNLYPGISRLLMNTNFYNLLDKFDTLNIFSFSPIQLADYFTSCFYFKFGFTILAYSNFLYYKQCIPMFGTKILTDPMGIDLTEKVKEEKTTWYWLRVIARNKAGSKLLLRLQPCGWFCSTFFQTMANVFAPP